MNTQILSSNPQTAIKAMSKHAFLCIAPNGHKDNLVFDKTMVAVDTQAASIKKMAKAAKALGLSDATHTIYQVCPNGVVYQYSIDKN